MKTTTFFVVVVIDLVKWAIENASDVKLVPWWSPKVKMQNSLCSEKRYFVQNIYNFLRFYSSREFSLIKIKWN